MGGPPRGAVPSLVSDAGLRKSFFSAPGWRVGLSPLREIASLLGSPCMMEGVKRRFVSGAAGPTRSCRTRLGHYGVIVLGRALYLLLVSLYNSCGCSLTGRAVRSGFLTKGDTER